MRNLVEEEMKRKVESLKNLPPDQGWQELTQWAAGAQIRWEHEEATRPPWHRPQRFRTTQEYRDQ